MAVAGIDCRISNACIQNGQAGLIIPRMEQESGLLRSGFYLEHSKGERHQGDLEPIAIVKYVPYFPKDIVHLVEESLGSTPMKLENRKGARSGPKSQKLYKRLIGFSDNNQETNVKPEQVSDNISRQLVVRQRDSQRTRLPLVPIFASLLPVFLLLGVVLGVAIGFSSKTSTTTSLSSSGSTSSSSSTNTVNAPSTSTSTNTNSHTNNLPPPGRSLGHFFGLPLIFNI